LRISIKDIPFRKKRYVFQKNMKFITPFDYILFYLFFKNSVMNVLVFNFYKMTDMHKGYAYQPFDFIIYKKIRIDVCVVCPYCALK
jgi:hypothetical protein